LCRRRRRCRSSLQKRRTACTIDAGSSCGASSCGAAQTRAKRIRGICFEIPQHQVQTTLLLCGRHPFTASSSVHPEIAGILLVNEHDGALSNEIQPVTRDPLRQEPWYLSAIQSPSTVQLHPRPIGRNLRMDYIYREASICPSVPCSPCPRWSPPASWRSLISVRSW
jgi:hypothetical protein